MEITSDIILKGEEWDKAMTNLSPIFANRTHYEIFMLSLSVGILYDKRIEKFSETEQYEKTVPRNVLQNNDNGKLDTFFQAAILSTTTESYTEDQRLDLAFGDKPNPEFNKLKFLVEFANFGVTKLNELVGSTTLETMDNIRGFVLQTVEGHNLEIDSLPDDILAE